MKKQKNAIIGIYKITSPSGKIYIGQSSNIKHRIYLYKSLCCKNQIKIYNSIKKYGWEDHKFEIIEECLSEQLDEREIYWIGFYNSIEEGLNLKEGGKYGTHSIETRNKISNSKKGKTIIDGEWAKNISKGRTGLKQTEETKIKIKLGNIGRIVSEETKSKISKNNKGLKRSEECKSKISKNRKGLKQPQKFIDKMSKPIIQYDLENNFIKEWPSAKSVTRELGINGGNLSSCVNGKYQKTAGGFIWKIK